MASCNESALTHRPDLNDFVREQMGSLTRSRMDRQQGLL